MQARCCSRWSAAQPRKTHSQRMRPPVLGSAMTDWALKVKRPESWWDLRSGLVWVVWATVTSLIVRILASTAMLTDRSQPALQCHSLSKRCALRNLPYAQCFTDKLLLNCHFSSWRSLQGVCGDGVLIPIGRVGLFPSFRAWSQLAPRQSQWFFWLRSRGEPWKRKNWFASFAAGGSGRVTRSKGPLRTLSRWRCKVHQWCLYRHCKWETSLRTAAHSP